MKILLLIFLAPFLNSFAYAEDVNRTICDEMIRFQQSGKSFDTFKLEFLDKFNEGYLDPVKKRQLKDYFGKIQEDLNTRQDPVVNCASAVGRSSQIHTEDMAEPVINHELIMSTFNNNSMLRGAMEAVAVEQGLHCPKVSIKPEELCIEPYIPALLFIQSPSFTYLTAISEWEKNKVAPPSYSVADCNCLINKMRDKAKQGTEVNKGIDLASEKLNKMVINAAGKKLLNEYAANYEDVGFYLNNKADVLTGQLFGPKRDYGDLLCNNIQEIRESVDKACKTNGVSPKDMLIRLEDLLGSLGNNFKGKNIETIFKMLGNEISTLKVDSKNLPNGQASEFSRYEFDGIRNGLSQSEPHVPFVDYLTTAMIKNESFSKELQVAVEKNVPPYLALQEIIDNPANKFTIKKMMDDLGTSHPELKAFIKLQNDKTTKITFDSALNVNPGLKTLLNNKELFLEMKERARSKDKNLSILQTMESEKRALTKHFENKCKKFREHLAVTACTPAHELLKQVSREDMKGVIAKLNPKAEREERDLLDFNVCMARPGLDRDPSSPFENLHMWDPYSYSDLYDRKTNPFADQTNPFTVHFKKMTDKNSNALNSYLAGVTKRYGSGRIVAPMSFERDAAGKITHRPISSSKDAKSFDPQSRQAPANKMSEVSRVEEKSKSLVNTSGTIQPSSQQSNVINNAVRNNNTFVGTKILPQSQNVFDNSTEQSAAGSRDKLKDILAPKGTDSRTERFLSNISDKDAETLLKLREQAAKDRQEITDLKFDAEKKSMDDLKHKYEGLEKKYAESLKHRAEKQTSSFGNSSEPSFSTSGLKGENNLQGDGSLPQATEGSVGSAGMKSSTGRNLAVSDSKEIKDAVSAKSENNLVVEESSVNPTGKSFARDADEEIYSFLDTKEQTIGSLEQLKVTGVTYRFRVVNENGISSFEERVIPYAKLSPKIRDLLERKLLAQVKRAYSIQALKYELMAMDRFVNKQTL